MPVLVWFAPVQRDAQLGSVEHQTVLDSENLVVVIFVDDLISADDPVAPRRFRLEVSRRNAVACVRAKKMNAQVKRSGVVMAAAWFP